MGLERKTGVKKNSKKVARLCGGGGNKKGETAAENGKKNVEI